MIGRKPTKNTLSRILWIVKHEIFCLSRFLFIRDRLRCPVCKKVGTWKPHRPPRRWLCKWCGYYVDIRGDAWTYPCAEKRVWMLRPKKKRRTPRERMRTPDPWAGYMTYPSD